MGVNLYPTAVAKVAVGGTAVTAAYGPLAGGFITNPATNVDQGILRAEPLFVSLLGTAALAETATTFEILPGYTFVFPDDLTANVSINAATSGHRFSGVVIQNQSPFTPTTGAFPPVGPVTLLQTIKAYLYQQYSDDDDLQAFFAAYNAATQQYIDWFNQIGLPIYTGPMIVGPLLDWVAQGLYGIARPALPFGHNTNLGPFNTWAFNTLPFNEQKIIGSQDFYLTDDDVFKRVITWSFYKGDGKYFNARWLKRRVMRFLVGLDGTAPNVDATYQVSVTFGVDNQVNINIYNGLRTVIGGAIYNRFAFNTTPFNAIETNFVQYAPLALAPVLKEAIAAEVLPLPFQFDFIVNIIG